MLVQSLDKFRMDAVKRGIFVLQQGFDDPEHVAALEGFQTARFQSRPGEGDLAFGSQQRIESQNSDRGKREALR